MRWFAWPAPALTLLRWAARLQVGSGFSGECVRTGRSLRCDDSETDDRVDRDGCRALGIRSMIAVPIRVGNKVSGLLEVFSPQPYAFNADDIGALQQLTGSIRFESGSSLSKRRSPSSAGNTDSACRRDRSPAPASRTGAPAEDAAGVRDPAATRIASPRQDFCDSASLHKALLVAAIGTFVFAVLWLIAPWVSSTLALFQANQFTGSASRELRFPSRPTCRRCH